MTVAVSPYSTTTQKQSFPRRTRKKSFSSSRTPRKNLLSQENFPTEATFDETSEDHILHPKNREWFLKELQKGRDSHRAGLGIELTPQLFNDIFEEAKEEYSRSVNRPPLSEKALEDIRIGEDDIKNGRVLSETEFWAEVEQWIHEDKKMRYEN